MILGLPAIETTMEKIVRTYSRNFNIRIIFGDKFKSNCTDTIWIPRIDDRADPYIRIKHEVVMLHENGHILYTDHNKGPQKNKQLFDVYNSMEDARIEMLEEEEWQGIKYKRIDFLKEFVPREYNNKLPGNSSLFWKVISLTYLRATEYRYGEDFGLKVPEKVQKLWEEKAEEFVIPVAKARTQSSILKLAKELYEKLKDTEPPKQEPQKGPGKSQGSQEKSQDSAEKPQEAQDDHNEEKQDSEDGEQDSKDSGDKEQNSKDSGDDGEQDSKDSGDGERDSKDSGDGERDSKDSGDEERDSEDGKQDSGNGKGSDKEKDENKKAREELAEEIEDGERAKTLNEEMAEQVNRYADSTCTYREANGLKDRIVRSNANPGWEQKFRVYQGIGKKMVGYSASRMRTLFMSKKAPRWQSNLQSGRLNLRQIWNDDKKDVFRRKTEGLGEDSAISMVIDYSGSMAGKRNTVASSLMIILSDELDKLRIAFEASGFVSNAIGDGYQAGKGIRTAPIDIHLLKAFEEPYRKVRHRFIGPRSFGGSTIDFPNIKFAAERLAMQPQTKKILFILSDGGTFCGNIIMDGVLLKAMKEYIERLMKAGFFVVGFGMENNSISNYCPDNIIVDNLDEFPKKFYRKLTDVLLKGVHG